MRQVFGALTIAAMALVPDTPRVVAGIMNSTTPQSPPDPACLLLDKFLEAAKEQDVSSIVFASSLLAAKSSVRAGVPLDEVMTMVEKGYELEQMTMAGATSEMRQAKVASWALAHGGDLEDGTDPRPN